ncbi:MAG: carotenoid biosynthesis protein, partial [Planctomycetales bacterium]|nr:carotenoid biosynthesis protein [Planctomycetales bacterium]
PRGAPGTVLLAAVLMTLADVVVDPIATAGDEWFLGRIHEYPGGGVHFGVPLSNYGGWLLTAAAITGIWAAADRFGGARPPDTPRRVAPGAALYAGVVLFALSVTWVVALRRTDPIRRGEGLLLAGTSGLLVAALAAATAVSVRKNRRPPPAGGDRRQGPDEPGLPFPG